MGELRFKDSFTGPTLRYVVSVALSPDDEYLYAVSHAAAVITVFRRSPETGLLTFVQAFPDESILEGAIDVAVNRTGTLVAVASFRADTVALFSRDGSTGLLTLLDVAREVRDGVRVCSAMCVEFSANGQRLYVASDSAGSLATFRVEGTRLVLEDVSRGTGLSLLGARGLHLSGDGRQLFVVANRANALSVFDCGLDGTLTLRQTITMSDVPEMDGVFGVSSTSDGRFVYTTSGRFRGVNAVCTFERSTGGRIVLRQRFPNLPDFEGGNGVAVSPDERLVVVTATNSKALLVFERKLDDGLLRQPAMLRDGEDGPLDGVCTLAITADRRFVYVAAERDNAISVFEWPNDEGGGR